MIYERNYYLYLYEKEKEMKIQNILKKNEPLHTEGSFILCYDVNNKSYGGVSICKET